MLEDRQPKWDNKALLSRRSWKRQLPEVVGQEFQDYLEDHPGVEDDLDAFVFDAAELPSLATFAEGIRVNLLEGDGVAWTYGLDAFRLSAQQQQLFYVAFGRAMGDPMTQYGLLYPVKDRGEESGYKRFFQVMEALDEEEECLFHEALELAHVLTEKGWNSKEWVTAFFALPDMDGIRTFLMETRAELGAG